MTTTASQNLTEAHRSIYDLASRISDYLSEYEGSGATLSFADIASGVGIDLRSLSKTDGYVFYMAAEASTEFRGWKNVSETGEPARFVKLPTMTEWRKPSESPVARSRRRARA